MKFLTSRVITESASTLKTINSQTYLDIYKQCLPIWNSRLKVYPQLCINSIRDFTTPEGKHTLKKNMHAKHHHNRSTEWDDCPRPMFHLSRQLGNRLTQRHGDAFHWLLERPTSNFNGCRVSDKGRHHKNLKIIFIFVYIV